MWKRKMILKIVDLEKKINDCRIFLGLEQINRKREKERLLEDNKKSNKVFELEEKLKTVEEEKDESNGDGSLIQELKDQVKTLNERYKCNML